MGTAGYHQESGSGDAVVDVPPGAKVIEYSAVGGVGGGTVEVELLRGGSVATSFGAVSVVEGQPWWTRPFVDMPGVGLVGPARVRFVGTSQYFVSWVS